MIQDKGYIVEIKENAFNLPGVVAIVSEVATILASLAADLNLAAMAGPYLGGDHGTEEVKSRRYALYLTLWRGFGGSRRMVSCGRSFSGHLPCDSDGRS